MAISAYASAITINGKFPFTYYYRGICDRANHEENWKEDLEKARFILEITTKLDFVQKWQPR